MAVPATGDRHLSPSDFSCQFSHPFVSADFSHFNLPSFPFCSIGGFVKTWLPFVLFLGVIVTVVLTLHLR